MKIIFEKHGKDIYPKDQNIKYWKIVLPVIDVPSYATFILEYDLTVKQLEPDEKEEVKG